MGTTQPPQKCFLTNLSTNPVNTDSSWDVIEYFILLYGKQFNLVFEATYENTEFINENKKALIGLIINGKIKLQPKEFLTKERVERYINEARFPKTPKEKSDYLLIVLHEKLQPEGAEMDLSGNFSLDYLTAKSFFNNNNETLFYLNVLHDNDLIGYQTTFTKSGTHISKLKLKVKGFEKVIELQESGEKSNRCFVAMSFSKEQEEIREVLRISITKSGYRPIFIDEVHFDSDVTINDEMIRQIKMCKFLVADFTAHKHGVYFEAGYALGKGKPVIYTCSRFDFENTHFDTNHYPHIVYESLDELDKGLVSKIGAWID